MRSSQLRGDVAVFARTCWAHLFVPLVAANSLVGYALLGRTPVDRRVVDLITNILLGV